MKPVKFQGADLYPALLDEAAQKEIVADIRAVMEAAPPQRFETRRGRRLSVAMTSAGRVGWISDRAGYRYAPTRPDGRPWPEIPDSVLAVWRRVVGEDRLPDSCLVNFYAEGARMGLHQDRDEGDFSWPVVSISLGDDALFRVGGVERPAPSRSVWLRSGDVVVLGGASRLAFHGIDRIRFGSSRLLEGGGRLNLTLRVVERA